MRKGSFPEITIGLLRISINEHGIDEIVLYFLITLSLSPSILPVGNDDGLPSLASGLVADLGLLVSVDRLDSRCCMYNGKHRDVV